MHRQREAWQEDGVVPTHPSVAMTMSWTPPPGTEGIIVEANTWTEQVAIDGLPDLLLNGRIDYIDSRDTRAPLIIDWKGKGASFPKGIKTAKAQDKVRAELEVDAQLNLYGVWVLKVFPEAETVSYAHGYMGRIRDPKKPGAVLPAWAQLIQTRPIPRAQVEATVKAMEPGFEAMKVAAELQPEDLPFPAVNPRTGRMDACTAFGEPCPFLSRCKGDTDAEFADFFPEEDVGLVDKLKESPGRTAIPNPADYVGTASATPPPAAGDSDGTASALLRKLRGGA
jgi:hypothetical protein